MGLFAKKKSEEKTNQVQGSQDAAANEKPARKYFEVFGDTLNELKFFKTLSLCLVVLAIFLVLTLKASLKKPPLVIRVDQIGRAVPVADANTSGALTEPEIANFAQYFLQYFTAWNVYTYNDDFERAFGMMTRDAIRKLNDYLRTNQVESQIRNEQIKIKLTVTDIAVDNNTPDVLNLTVKGYRDITSYANSDIKREQVFEDKLVLKKVVRNAAAPWGLLVDDWSESLFKK